VLIPWDISLSTKESSSREKNSTSMGVGKITLPYEIEYSLQRLIENEIELQSSLSKQREELSHRHDFNAAEIY
jgi:hypothetical protein